MLYLGKELLEPTPKLRSLLDSLLNKFPKQETFWDNVIKKYPNWNNEQFGWMLFEEPLSDNTEILKSIINSNVQIDDIVLTTVNHAPFFAMRTNKIHVYDISPIQLRNRLLSFPDVQSSWFCDIYHLPMLTEVLEKTQPTVLYLSNIPDYGTQNQLVQLFFELHSSQSINTVIFSTHCAFENSVLQMTANFERLLKKNNWNFKSYEVNDTHAFFKIKKI
jgi:hypothetical protein